MLSFFLVLLILSYKRRFDPKELHVSFWAAEKVRNANAGRGMGNRESASLFPCSGGSHACDYFVLASDQWTFGMSHSCTVI